ncbi:MAG: endonuclease/exonuclease/phosphatase family protein [Acholeplasmataceae bacterium]
MRIIKKVLFLLLIICIIPVGLVLVLTVFEYRPKPIETIAINNEQSSVIELDEPIRIMTFNIGYAGLGADEDFILDGGTKGRADSKEVVLGYLDGITDLLTSYPIDIYLLQEVDLKARRSYHMDQVAHISDALGMSMSQQYAYNFNVLFVPFPLSVTDHIGYVKSGLMTLMPYEVSTSERHQFPGAFSWPLRAANLKRAMLVSRLSINESDKELVVVNLHMSAYDADGNLRNQEMAYLKDFMAAEYALGNYVIIGGDFNQTFPEAVGIYEVDSAYYQAFPIEDDFLPSGFDFKVDLSAPTCRLLNQPYDPEDDLTFYYIIDGFIVSDNISIETFESLGITPGAVTIDHDFLYSDHNPVVIEIKLNP